MTSRIALEQLCYTSVPAGVRETSGWQFMAQPAHFEKARVVHAHCQYTLPRYPADRDDAHMPIDYGFRHLDDQTCCIYRTVFAGLDDFNRRSNYLTHTLTFPRDALDAIDADILALFAWARREHVFLADWKEVRDRFRASAYRTEPVLVDPTEIRSIRRALDRVPLIDRLAPYPPPYRKTAATEALRVALAPPDHRRTVVWTAPANGLDNSEQEFAVLDFLFAALPYSWRMRATFSTYKRRIEPRDIGWFGQTHEGSRGFNEEQRLYEFYLVNFIERSESSPLPAPDHPWIQRVLDSLDEAPNRSSLGRDRRIVSWFAARSDDDLYTPDGFLARASLAARALRDEAPHDDLLATMDDARGCPELLDLIHERDDREKKRTGRRWPERTDSEVLVRAYARFLTEVLRQDPTALASTNRAGAVRDTIVTLLCESLAAKNPAAADPLIEFLRSGGLADPLAIDTVETWMDRMIADFAKPTSKPGALDRILAALEPLMRVDAFTPPHLESVLSGYRNRASAMVLRMLREHPHEITEEIVRSARQRVLPHVERHVPSTAADLERILEVLAEIRRQGGEDLIPSCLVAVSHNVPQPSCLPDLDSRRYLFLQDAPTWRREAGRMPVAWQSMIHEMSGTWLWSSFWESFPPKRRVEYCKHLREDLVRARTRPDIARPFVDAVCASGVSQIRAALTRSTTSRGSVERMAYLAACAQILDLTAAFAPSAPDLWLVVVDLLIALAKESRALDTTLNATLEAIAAALVKVTTKTSSRLPIYQRLAAELARARRDRKYSSEPSSELLNLWETSFTTATNDPLEGKAARHALTACHIASCSLEDEIDAHVEAARTQFLASLLVEAAYYPDAPSRPGLIRHCGKIAEKNSEFLGEFHWAVCEALLNKATPEPWITEEGAGWRMLLTLAPDGDRPLAGLFDGPGRWPIVAILHRACRKGPIHRRLSALLGRALDRCFQEAQDDPLLLTQETNAPNFAYLLTALSQEADPELRANIRSKITRVGGSLRKVDRYYWQRIDITSRLSLSIWFEEAGLDESRATEFWGTLRADASSHPDQITKLLVPPHLGLAKPTEINRWETKQRTRVGIRLFVPHCLLEGDTSRGRVRLKPEDLRRMDALGVFLATLGAPPSSDAATEPSAIPYDCDILALAVATYLKGTRTDSFVAVDTGPNWYDRLKALLGSTAWETVRTQRHLDVPARWERFQTRLQREVGDFKPGETIIRRLRRGKRRWLPAWLPWS